MSFPPQGQALPAPDRLLLLHGERLATALLAHRPACAKAEADVVEQLRRLVRHVASVPRASVVNPPPVESEPVDAALSELKERLGKLTDLRRTEAVLVWDMTVFMPPGGGPTRAAQLATLEEVLHAHAVDDRLGELFEELAPYAASLPYDSDDASLIRVAQRDWERERRVPAALAVEFAKTSAESYEVWVKAREDSDFALFRPWLERIVELRKQYVECFAPYDDPYDVLLEDYEPGMRTSEIREVFAVLASELPALVAEHATDEEDAFMDGPFPIGAQDALSRELVEAFGATWDQFRLDPTVHPFEVTFGLGDIRLTTRYAENELTSLFTAMHETGHGIYEWGVSKTLERTPLAAGVSATLHESQSRLWENVVGRSLPFWRWFYPRVAGHVPRAARGRLARAVPSRGQPCAPLVHPRRRRRDELRAPRHPPLRARGGAALRPARRRRPPRRVEHPFRGADGHLRAERRDGRPPGRALVGRGLRLLPDLPSRHGSLGPDLGEGARRDSRGRRADRARRVR